MDEASVSLSTMSGPRGGGISPNEAGAETIATYDATAASFADLTFDIDLGAQLDRLAALLPSGSRVLDAGCGPGRDVQHLRQRGFDAIGLDRSRGMLDQASRRVNGRWVCGDLRALPFADRAFHGVWACASLLHLFREDMPKALRELRRVLDDGFMFLAMKEGEGGELESLGPSHRRYFAYYQPAELHRLCGDAGFTVLESLLLVDERRPGTTWIHLLLRVA